MLPPSDSLQHQHLKLAEALSNMQAIEVPPPPIYTATTKPVVNDSSFLAYRIDDDDDVDDDDGDCPGPLAPVAVHIDASIRIEGLGNMVILPAAHPNTNANTNANANASALQGQPMSPTPQIGAPQTSPSSARAERLTSTILSALQNAGVIGSGGQAGSGPWQQQQRQQQQRQQQQQQQQQRCSSLYRPLELHVNASVSVSGERNVICAGVSRGPVGSGSGNGVGNGNGSSTVNATRSPAQGLTATPAASKKVTDVVNGDDSDSDGDGKGTKEQKGGRKRRADSEPVEARKARKAGSS